MSSFPFVRRRFFLIMALLLAALACNIPTPTPPAPGPTGALTQTAPGELPAPTPSAAAAATTAAPPPSPTAPAYRAEFEPARCDFAVPQGYAPECGYLSVPQDRARPEAGRVRLHVAVFRSRAADPAPDPLVYLSGGPGSSALDSAAYLFSYGMGAALERRDLVLFDQRGTGRSQPRLDCPEARELEALLLAREIPVEEETRAAVEAFGRCRARLEAEGVDLAAYHSAASAADLEDLRKTLGYPQLNLYAVSYGTRLALTLMRDFPHAVRSAVLDSAYPPQVHLYTALAPNAQRAFDVFFGLCASDPGCSAAYPDLEAVFYNLVEALNASPLPVTFTAYGEEHRARLDGGLLVDVLFTGLYNPQVAAAMPAMIYALNRGETRRLQPRLALYLDSSSALGMNMAVQCNEETPFSPPQEAYTLARDTHPALSAFFPDSVQPLFAVCQDWGLEARAGENDPVTAETPALVLAGEFDPITPPEWGRLAAAGLAQAAFFEFPAHGHWVTRSSECALALALAFWEAPTLPPDPTCTLTPDRLEFAR